MYDVQHIRTLFPALSRKVMGKDLVYLDNTATSQTPAFVVDDIVDNYYNRKANVHRGVHTLSQEATARQEETRRKVRDFINADFVEEIIFFSNMTRTAAGFEDK